jgi:hypothetical protein
MAICETCGNDYDKTFQVVQSGKAHTFDSFRMRDPCPGAYLCALRHPYRWSRP